ncbi:MAG: hypothetical protein E7082_01475 [Bacteroidales bacterium]|nr:hypothetical protein [Bacteroidales bacterium]
MKKFLLMACGLCLASVSFAQESALKEAERGLKVEVPDHSRIASLLEGAMQDPSTANNVKTWFLAGKNAFQTWQTGWELLQQGGIPDKVNMSLSIVKGYDYYVKALPMDTVVNEKGKVKTKYSKEIVKTLSTSSNNFYDAGVFLYEANDLKNAYRAWEIFTLLPQMTQLGKDAPLAPADSILATTYYNMGIFAYQADMKPEAMKSFTKAARLGQGEVAYDNALAMASELGDMAALEEIASEAFNIYGTQNYIYTLVSVYVKNGQYDTAFDIVNKALEANPNNAVLYNVKGVLVENRTNDENITPEEAAAANAEALELYKKSVELDPQSAESRYNYGRVIANQAYKLSEDPATIEMSTNEFNLFKAENIDPLFIQAAEQLEAAISINPEANRQAFSILKNIYYNLGDEENMNRIAELELK